MKTLLRNALRLFDLLLFPFTCVALAWLRLVRFGGMRRMPMSRAAIRAIGIFPLRDHFYEPLFHPRHLPPGHDRVDRELPGVDLDVAGQLQLLAQLRYGGEIEAFSKAPRGPGVPNFLAGNFGAGDSEFLYSMVRHAKPRRIFEIGSGNSSLVSLAALAKNGGDDAARGGELTCIDPHAPAKVDATGARVVRQKVEELGRGFFAELGRDDLLFIDSSHVIRPRGDVLFEFLELLPTLAPGVLVHVHDVYTPRDYPAAHLEERSCFWNEQYLLEAFLTQNRDFRVVAALNHLWHHHFEELAAACPLLRAVPAARPGSFWMVRA
jgi:predicted O-methyltransferase YrrM